MPDFRRINHRLNNGDPHSPNGIPASHPGLQTVLRNVPELFRSLNALSSSVALTIVSMVRLAEIARESRSENPGESDGRYP